jgi:hypothetical protein
MPNGNRATRIKIIWIVKIPHACPVDFGQFRQTREDNRRNGIGE